jgi:hypothetical protein
MQSIVKITGEQQLLLRVKSMGERLAGRRTIQSEKCKLMYTVGKILRVQSWG